MKTAAKSWILNMVVLFVGTVTLLFSFVATWVIIHRVTEIMTDLSVSSNMVIGGSIAMGLTLVWLNSMLFDSVIWTACRCWNRIDNNKQRK
jgi:hypothetical protein